MKKYSTCGAVALPIHAAVKKPLFFIKIKTIEDTYLEADP